MAGNATVRQPSAGRHLERAPVAGGQQRGLAAARRRARPARRCGSTWRAGSRPAGRRLRVARRRSRRAARHSARIAGPPARWIAPSTPPPPSSDLVGGVDDRVDDLLRDVAEHDLDASGHLAVSIDFAHAPTPILPRRARLQPQDGREGGDAARPTWCSSTSRTPSRRSRRTTPRGRTSSTRSRATSGRRRRASCASTTSTPRGASATSSTSSRAHRTRSTASWCRRCRGPIRWPSCTTC